MRDLEEMTGHSRPMTIQRFAEGLLPVPLFILTLWMMIAIPPLGAAASLLLIVEALRRKAAETDFPWLLPLLVSTLTLSISILVMATIGFWNIG